MRFRLLTAALFMLGFSAATAAETVTVADSIATRDSILARRPHRSVVRYDSTAVAGPRKSRITTDSLITVSAEAIIDSAGTSSLSVTAEGDTVRTANVTVDEGGIGISAGGAAEEIASASRDTLKYGQIYLDDGSVTYTDAFLDTTDVKKKRLINDYTLIGIQYGAAMTSMSWNPAMEQGQIFTPINIGITWTRYGKIFGYMPYFGIQAGVFYTQEGYKLDEGYTVSGAREVKMNIIEIPALAHCHFDFWKMKLFINIGIYGSYRLDIERSNEDTELPPSFAHNFLSTDHRFDYGLKGGGGFGFIFDPIEIHFSVMYKYGWGSLYDADYYSEYYYRFAHVSSLIFSVGVHYQITKRTGMTKSKIRKEAKRIYLEQKYGTGE